MVKLQEQQRAAAESAAALLHLLGNNSSDLLAGCPSTAHAIEQQAAQCAEFQDADGSSASKGLPYGAVATKQLFHNAAYEPEAPHPVAAAAFHYAAALGAGAGCAAVTDSTVALEMPHHAAALAVLADKCDGLSTAIDEAAAQAAQAVVRHSSATAYSVDAEAAADRKAAPKDSFSFRVPAAAGVATSACESAQLEAEAAEWAQAEATAAASASQTLVSHAAATAPSPAQAAAAAANSAAAEAAAAARREAELIVAAAAAEHDAAQAAARALAAATAIRKSASNPGQHADALPNGCQAGASEVDREAAAAAAEHAVAKVAAAAKIEAERITAAAAAERAATRATAAAVAAAAQITLLREELDRRQAANEAAQ